MKEVKFEEVFNIEELQKLMDSLSQSFEIGMGIINPKGEKLIKDSYCCDFCNNVIKKSPLGKEHCDESDRVLASNSDGNIHICRCKSAGLIDAGFNLVVDGENIATLLAGQVRLEGDDISDDEYRERARKLGIDEEVYLEGIHKVPVMSRAKFENILSSLEIIASHISRLGYHSLKQQYMIKNLETKESDWKKDKQQFRKMAEMDVLTGLYNRSKFEDIMSHFQKENSESVCIISGDANNLKLMNDIFGHEAGDIMLKSIAMKLKEVAKPNWYVARCGGDEYRVLLPDTTLEAAQDYCNRVARNCKTARALNLPLSIALGAAQWDKQNESIQECFNRADENMYKNKKEMKKQENLLDYILEKLYDKEYLKKDVVEKTAQTVYDFVVHLGFNDEESEKIYVAAKYMDIGYIHLSESLMLYGQAVNETETKKIHEHVEWGYKIALQFENTHKSAEIIRHSHENWDGSGYPDKMAGRDIPMESRIIRIVKKYIQLVVGIENKKPVTHKEAVELMKQFSGQKYDPDVLEWFIGYMESSMESNMKNNMECEYDI